MTTRGAGGSRDQHEMEALRRIEDPVERAAAVRVTMDAMETTERVSHADVVSAHQVMADAIREAQRAGKTVEDIAAALGVTEGRVYQWLSPSGQES